MFIQVISWILAGSLVCASAYGETQTNDDYRADGEYVSAFVPGLNPPVSETAQAAKRKSIANKLKMIASRLALVEGRQDQINHAFNEAWREHQKQYEVYKGKRWARIDKGFFTLPPQYELLPSSAEVNQYEQRWHDNINALLALSEMMEANGVQLFVVMYPNANVVSSRVFVPEFADTPNLLELRVAQRLLQNDIEVITFTDRAVAQATSYPFMFFYPDDFHPGEGTGEVAAQVIAEHLQRFDAQFVPRLDSADFARFSENNVYREKFTYPDGVDIGSHEPGAIVRIHKTYYRGKPIKFDPASKLLVCGHSFTQTPASSAFLSSAIAGRIQYIPHHLRISSVGPYTSIPRRLMSNRNKLLRGKVACVMVFDPYFGISDTIELVNVKTLDERWKSINARTVRHTFDLSAMNAQTLPADEATQRFLQAVEADLHGYPVQYLAKAGETRSVGRLELPASVPQSAGVWVLIEFALGNKQAVELDINGQSFATEFHQVPTWQEVFVELPVCQREIEVQFKALSAPAFVSVRKIAIYQ